MSGLKENLQEYKNPIVIITLSILTALIFYYKNISELYFILFFSIPLILFSVFKKSNLILFSIFLGISYLYTGFYIQHSLCNLNFFLNKKNIFIGEVISTPQEGYFYSKKYFFKINEIINNDFRLKKLNCNVQVNGKLYENVEKGEIVQLCGKLQIPKEPSLDGFFDEKKYLFQKYANYILKKEDGNPILLDYSLSKKLLYSLDVLRKKILKIQENDFNGEKLELLNGIIFGSRTSNLSTGLKDKIQSLGLSHLTSASGFNVSIIAFSIFLLFRIFTVNKIVPSIIVSLMVLFYSYLASFSPSIIRASIFIYLIVFGSLFNKKLRLLPGIGIIIILFFFFSPLSLLDIGLQLSIVAFLGIILFQSEVEKRFTVLKNNFILNAFSQTLIAQIFVVPLIGFYFHNIQILGVISNVLAIPLASIILILGILNILFSPIIFFNFLNVLLNFFLNIFIDWVNFLSTFPIQKLELPGINFYTLLIIYFFIFIFLIGIFIRELRLKSVNLLLAIILLFYFNCLFFPKKEYIKLYAIKHYNHDSVLILTPNKIPVFISNKLDPFMEEKIKYYLSLNNIFNDIYFYNTELKKWNIKYNPTLNKYISINKNDIEIHYKKFKFNLVNNYSEKINSVGFGIKLPILKKDDPDLKNIFKNFPSQLIVNDYKRLSKKSIKNKEYLKKQKSKIYFLSEVGTVEISSDGINHKIN